MVEIKKSYCGLCHPRCGTLLHIENGKIVKVTGDPDHPVTRGVICERGRLMPDHVHHPQRLNYPLKRKGEKGQGEWQRLTWEQALDEVADKLSKLNNTIQEGAAAAARVFDILDEDPGLREKENPALLKEGPLGVSFHHVSFAYGPEEKPALKDISLTVAPGEVLALVGMS
ncbi:MAG: molybdopterin-dependent oxidoreductase, partial [Desulfobacterales bacterium]|nr:molybdopterin-dependent oxidoreductase [Desulfobacterales bacterium]